MTHSPENTAANNTNKCIWLTGLSGAGKTTIALAISKCAENLGINNATIDGDSLREVFPDLGFSKADRDKNVMYAGEKAHAVTSCGKLAIASLISPYRDTRLQVRSMFEEGQFIEVYVSTPLEVCEARDPKGLYKRVRNNEIQHFTGIHDPYEPPLNPEIMIDTQRYNPQNASMLIMRMVMNEGDRS